MGVPGFGLVDVPERLVMESKAEVPVGVFGAWVLTPEVSSVANSCEVLLEDGETWLSVEETTVSRDEESRGVPFEVLLFVTIEVGWAVTRSRLVDNVDLPGVWLESI